MNNTQTLANQLWNKKWEEFKEEYSLEILIKFMNFEELENLLMESIIKEINQFSNTGVEIRCGNKVIQLESDIGEQGWYFYISTHNLDVPLSIDEEANLCKILKQFPLKQAMETISLQQNEELSAFLGFLQIGIEDIEYVTGHPQEDMLTVIVNNRYFYVFSEAARQKFLKFRIDEFKKEEQKRLDSNFEDYYKHDNSKWWTFHETVIEQYGEDYFINKSEFPVNIYNGYYIYEFKN